MATLADRLAAHLPAAELRLVRKIEELCDENLMLLAEFPTEPAALLDRLEDQATMLDCASAKALVRRFRPETIWASEHCVFPSLAAVELAFEAAGRLR